MTLIDIDSGTQVVDDNDNNSCDGSLTRLKRHSLRIGAKKIGIISTDPTSSSTVSSPRSLLDNGGHTSLDCDPTCCSSSNSSLEESDDGRDDVEGKKKKQNHLQRKSIDQNSQSTIENEMESKNNANNGNKQKNKTVIVGGQPICDTRFPAEDFILNSSNSLLPAINEKKKKKNTSVGSQRSGSGHRSASGNRSVISHQSSSSSSATDFVSIYDGSVDDEEDASSYQTASSTSTFNSFYKMIIGGYPTKTKSFIDDLLGGDDYDDHNDRKKKSLKKSSNNSKTSTKSITIDTIARGSDKDNKDIYYEDGGTVNTQSFTSMTDDPIELIQASSSSKFVVKPKRIIYRKNITKKDWFAYLSCCIIILLVIVTITLLGLYIESKENSSNNLNNTSNTTANTSISTTPQSDVTRQTPPPNLTLSNNTTTNELDERTTTTENNENNSTINSRNDANGTLTNINNTNSSYNNGNYTNDEEEKNVTQIFIDALMIAMNKSTTDPLIQTISSIYINAGGDEPLFDPSSNITWYPDNNYLKIDPPNQNNDSSSKGSLTTVYGNSTPFVYRNDNKCPDQVKMEDLILSLSSLLNGSHNQTVATELLCTERWFNEAEGTSRYTIPVPMNGNYQVILYFTEIWFQNPKERVFDIHVQSVQYQLKNFDINQKEKEINGNVPTTSSTYNPIVQVVAPSIWVTNGYITIDFIPKISNPKINAIVIHPILSTE